jgi:hypothetical protein
MELDRWDKDRGPAGVSVRVAPAFVVAAPGVSAGAGSAEEPVGVSAGAGSAEEPVGVSALGRLALSVMEGAQATRPLLMKPRLSVTKKPS